MSATSSASAHTQEDDEMEPWFQIPVLFVSNEFRGVEGLLGQTNTSDEIAPIKYNGLDFLVLVNDVSQETRARLDASSSIFDIWSTYFPLGMVQRAVRETNHYAQAISSGKIQRPAWAAKSGPWPPKYLQGTFKPFTEAELISVFGIAYIMGVFRMPVLDYWKNDEFRRCRIVQVAISRERFKQVWACMSFYSQASELHAMVHAAAETAPSSSGAPPPPHEHLAGPIPQASLSFSPPVPSNVSSSAPLPTPPMSSEPSAGKTSHGSSESSDVRRTADAAAALASASMSDAKPRAPPAPVPNTVSAASMPGVPAPPSAAPLAPAPPTPAPSSSSAASSSAASSSASSSSVPAPVPGTADDRAHGSVAHSAMRHGAHGPGSGGGGGGGGGPPAAGAGSASGASTSGSTPLPAGGDVSMSGNDVDLMEHVRPMLKEVAAAIGQSLVWLKSTETNISMDNVMDKTRWSWLVVDPARRPLFGATAEGAFFKTALPMPNAATLITRSSKNGAYHESAVQDLNTLQDLYVVGADMSEVRFNYTTTTRRCLRSWHFYVYWVLDMVLLRTAATFAKLHGNKDGDRRPVAREFTLECGKQIVAYAETLDPAGTGKRKRAAASGTEDAVPSKRQRVHGPSDWGDQRFAPGAHYPRHSEKQARCRVCFDLAKPEDKASCSRTTFVCVLCDVPLCLKRGKDCYEKWHTMPAATTEQASTSSASPSSSAGMLHMLGGAGPV